LGWFPNARAPKIFWVGVKADGGLAELARRTDETVARLGVPPEKRPFSPHLTLARIREQVPMARLQEAMVALPSEDFGEFTASRFHLFLSQPAASGSVYSKLAEFPLVRS
jgi:2'-5' RNA ligase